MFHISPKEMKFSRFGFGREELPSNTDLDDQALDEDSNILEFPAPKKYSIREEGYEDVVFPDGRVFTIEHMEEMAEAVSTAVRNRLAKRR